MKFFRATKNRKTIDETLYQLINLNNLYQSSIKIYTENSNPPCKKEDEKYLVEFQKKIRFTSIILHIKQQNPQKFLQNGPWCHSDVVKTDGTPCKRSQVQILQATKRKEEK